MLHPMQPVKTALVGLGYWGPHLLRNFAAQADCEMIWGVDLKEENLAKAKAHYPSVRYTADVEEVWKDPAVELVIIATPPSSHLPLALAALEAGKHVFVEKPLATTSADAQRMVDAAKKAGKMLFVDHTFVFAPAVEQMADMAARGTLGELLYFDSVRINLGIIQRDTNVLWDLAVHDLSILSAFRDLGDVRTVSARGVSHFGSQAEMAHLYLTFNDAFTAHVHVSWLSPVKIRQTILAGKDAMVTYDDIQPSEKLRVYDRGIEHDQTQPNPLLPTYRNGNILIPALPAKETLGLEAAHVLRCVRGKETPRVPGEDGVKMLRILEAADQSLRQDGTSIPLDTLTP
jgi:predicted dehydrogenase